MLNLIWISFFIVAFLTACVQALFFGQADVFAAIVRAMFDSSKSAFEISLGLTGVMTLWLGIMKIGENAGFMAALARMLNPLFARIFPAIPPDHPALGAMTMNIAANMLGLDNAATPMGLKAMQELQTLNPSKDTASNAQILFLVINTASVTLFPVTVFAYRAQLGAADPTDVFIPILIATYISTLFGFIAVALVQKINLFDRVILSYMVGLSLLVGGITLWFARLSAAQMQAQSALISNFLLSLLVVVFIGGAALKRVNVYDAFIDGAREGFATAVRIIPYLVAMLVGIAVLRASGALDLLMNGIRALVALAGWDTRFVDGVPTALMKTLSGSGARGMMIDTMKTQGADSFAGRLVSVIQGSTETTFYVLAVYFGSVGIKHTRHAVQCGLFADLVGFIAAVAVAYLFFG
ncbi:nucleoside recognition domain-containing protein [Herminiimonas sp. CN]|uniref:nucleoside recognition domain-containing protein n=1 Tax=Herminiimonas sp. CN TaxID=1349818 RepID=UPI0004733F56|nr:spore maturation protein [Herminiimonas sp. CN]